MSRHRSITVRVTSDQSELFAQLGGNAQAARILYNKALHVYRQAYFQRQHIWASNQHLGRRKLPLLIVPKLPSLGDLDKALQASAVYQSLGGALAQQVLRSLWASIENFWKAKGGGKANLPKYDRNLGRTYQYRADTVRMKTDHVTTPKPSSSFSHHVSGLHLPPPILYGIRQGLLELKTMRVTPRMRGRAYDVTFTLVSSTTSPEAPTSVAEAAEKGAVAAMDLGVDVLGALSIVDPRASKQAAPVLVSGLAWKHHVKHSGYRLDQAKSEMPMQSRLPWAVVERHQAVGVPLQPRHREATSRRMDVLWQHYSDKTRELVNATACWLVNHLVANNIKALVVGWNKQMKTSIQIGRVNNRIFVGIAFARLRRRLASLCEKHGILYVEVNESHTSKTSFEDGELPSRHEVYAGRRVRTKLFRTSSGARLHADVNASLQILTKQLLSEGHQNWWTPGLRSAVVKAAKNPVRVTV